MSGYGKSALSADLIAPDLNKYLARVKAAGNDIDALCESAVDEALPVVEAAMKAGAARHRRGVGKYGTDEVYNAIESSPAVRQGNLISGAVGIDTDKHPEAMHGVYQEYGDGHSPGFPDPFVRPAIDENRREIMRIMRGVLNRGGVPLE